MAFNRIGTPVNIDSVDFSKSTSLKCKECGHIIGEKVNNLVKLAGQNVVTISQKSYICTKCGKENHVI